MNYEWINYFRFAFTFSFSLNKLLTVKALIMKGQKLKTNSCQALWTIDWMRWT